MYWLLGITANCYDKQYSLYNNLTFWNTMKTMTCRELGGACELEFHAETFEEIAEMSKKHGMEMFQQKDQAHLKAMGEMQELMQSPDAMQSWMETKRKEFEAKPSDS